MSQQLSLIDKLKSNRGRKRKRPINCFGGSFFKNYNPDSQRPIQAKKALHIVLRSSLATGAKSFKTIKNQAKVWDIIEKHAKLNQIRLYSYANAGNHIHLLIRVKRRDDYCKFIRAISGLIARAVGGSQRGRALKQKFWDARPFSRIVNFGRRDFEKVKTYLLRNKLESFGFMPYFPRKSKLPPLWQSFLSTTITFPLE